MRAVFAIAAAVIGAAIVPAQAQEVTVVRRAPEGPHLNLFKGIASEDKDTVSISLFFRDDGSLDSMIATWALAPVASTDGVKLEIGYLGASTKQLGLPTSILAIHLPSAPPVPQGVGRIQLRLASGQSWSDDRTQTDKYWIGVLATDSTQAGRRNLDLIHAIETQRDVTLLLSASDGRELGRYRFDVSHHARREQLFRKALSNAQLAAKSKQH